MIMPLSRAGHWLAWPVARTGWWLPTSAMAWATMAAKRSLNDLKTRLTIESDVGSAGSPVLSKADTVGSWLCGGDQYPPSLTALSIA